MALVYRNGRPYLYKSVRKDGRVTSEYVGSGQTALLIGRLDAIERDDREEERRQAKADRQDADDLERALDDLAGRARDAARAALIAAGYHQHKGQWRKLRGDRHREGGDDAADDGRLGPRPADRVVEPEG